MNMDKNHNGSRDDNGMGFSGTLLALTRTGLGKS